MFSPSRAFSASSPASAGPWSWGGVWGHHWWVDAPRALTVVVMTNTAVEGLQGKFAEDLHAAVYAAV